MKNIAIVVAAILLALGAPALAGAQTRGQSPPSAPIRVSARAAGPGAAYVFWSAPYPGSSPITQYVVTAYEGLTVVGQKPILTMGGINFSTEYTGLAAGTYTFTVYAINAVGRGIASQHSNRVVITGAVASPPPPSPPPATPSVTLSSATIAPGGTVTLTGSSYPAGDQVVVDLAVQSTNGTSTTLSTTVFTNGAGQFSATLSLPGTVLGGRYTVVVHSMVNGQTISKALKVLFPATYTIAVEGMSQSLWVNHGSGFTNLGGTLLSAPAVVALPNGGHLYIATGKDHRLWVRSDTQGWQLLGPSYCLAKPAANLMNGTLTVACQGSNHALWTAGVALPAVGLPYVPSFTSLSGSTRYGPAIASVAGTLTYFVTGGHGRIWERTLTSGWQTIPSSCTSRPAAASNGVTTYLACRGTNGSLWYATNSGLGWSGFRSLGGHLVGGPGVAATLSGVIFAVEGGNHQVFWNEIGSSGVSSGWQALGGAALHGAAAAAI